MASTQQNHAQIVDWVGDITALISHIEEALDHQLTLSTDTPELKQTIQELHDSVRDQKRMAEQVQEQLGSTAGNPVVKAGSELLGKAAGLIDKVRKDSVAKALRDDYTALSHLTISYTMLHTTAMALKHDGAMQFAESGIRATAPLIMKITFAMPDAVVQDLTANNDLDVVDASVASECKQEIKRIWQESGEEEA